MKKTARTFVFLMILLLCLAVFVVACDKEAPEEQAPDTPPADTPSNEDPSTEDSTPSAPEQPAKKPLPEVLTAPLTETFAQGDNALIKQVNQELKQCGIQAIFAEEAFRTQHADTYIGTLGVSELYLETDAQGEQRIVRLVFDLGGLAAASVHATTEAPDWLQPRLITPVMIANIREDARMTMLQMLLNAGNTVSLYDLRSAWSAHRDRDFYFILGYDYYKLPEEHEATHLVVSMYDGKVNDVTLRYPQDEPTPPADFYPTPDVLYSEKNGVYKVFSKLCNVGYDVKNESALRALLRELWADDLLQSNDDYDTYALPDSPEMLVRVARIGTRGTVSTYAIPREHIDTRPVALCTPADILAQTDHLTEYLQQAVNIGYEGNAYHRVGLISHWQSTYIGSDDTTDYFYATVPTEQQIAANEMLDVLVIRYSSPYGTIVAADTEQHGADQSKFGGEGIEVLSIEAFLTNQNHFFSYLSVLHSVHGLTHIELREELRSAWAPYFLRTEVASVRDNVHNSAYPEQCLVSADIYSLHPLNGENPDSLQETELMWIEYYEDGSLRSIGIGTYVSEDKVHEC